MKESTSERDVLVSELAADPDLADLIERTFGIRKNAAGPYAR
jgi:hypothetical protein